MQKIEGCRKLFEGVPDVEWQFAIDMQHLDRTVDGVDVHEAYCPGGGRHRPENVFIASDYLYQWAHLIDLGDRRFSIGRGNSKKLLHRDVHFRGRWIL